MGRAVSWNWEIHLSENPEEWIYPSTLGEFSEGEEGRIDVADGDRKYKIKDQIYAIDEVEAVILLRTDRREYDLLQSWARAGDTRDITVVAKGAGRDAPAGGGRQEMMVFAFLNCQIAMGKKSAFDRQGKTFDTMTYFLIPEDIVEQTPSYSIY